MDTYSMGRFALGAVWVFCLLALTLWWIKKKKGNPFSKAQNKLIQVLEVYPLGLKSRMMLLEVDGERILVSVNAQEVKTLHTWKSSHRIGSEGALQDLTKAPQADATHFETSSFESLIRHQTGEGSSL
jgi:flagellar biogenesis protein FliO